MKEPLNALIVREGEGPQDAVGINEHIFMSRGITNCYLVTTPEGNVQINTGMYFEPHEIKRRFSAVSSARLRTIILTQGHSDHVGGWSQFTQPGIETIAQANHGDVREYWHRLQPYYTSRTKKLWSRDISNVDRSYQPPEAVVTTSFIESHSFELGGHRFDLYATPGGETTDALVVHLPAEDILFIGNLMGPLFGHLPNLYTVRGDKYRNGLSFIHALDRVLALEPKILITGHGEPIEGQSTIERQVKRVREATRYIRDRTIEGMNAGTDLWTLMGEVGLPAELDVPQGHGKVPWLVRAFWEEHSGWFRFESTTELYDIPPVAIWSELIELSGGATALIERAQLHLDAKRPLHALHFTDMVLAHHPKAPAALGVKLKALERLLEVSGRENFSEVRWLEAEIQATKDSIV